MVPVHARAKLPANATDNSRYLRDPPIPNTSPVAVLPLHEAGPDRSRSRIALVRDRWNGDVAARILPGSIGKEETSACYIPECLERIH